MIKPWLEYILFPTRKLDFNALAAEIQHKTILITGASFGIGEALCYRLADIDCHLILAARTEEKLQTIKQQLMNKKATVTIFTVDLANAQQCDAFITQLSDYHIDIFVSNAGKSICRPVMQSLDRYHDFHRTMQLNYVAPVKLCLALIPQLQKNKGQIINVSAVNVLLAPAPFWAAYQASKTAFDQWIGCVQSELSLHNIAVSSLYLPLVKTRMIAPTKAYQHMPAMTADQASVRIIQLMLNRRNYDKPWWSLAAQLSSVIFRRLWFTLTRYYLRHKHD